jgi:fructose-1,6-bisphosphatase
MQVYRDDPCERFPCLEDNAEFTEPELRLMAQMRAIAVIQWKLESQVILRRHYTHTEPPAARQDGSRARQRLRRRAGLPLLDTRFPTSTRTSL